MLTIENLFTACAPYTLTVYTEAHRPNVRDLAEMVSLATYNGGGYSMLTDPEDGRTAVFMECVGMYAAKHKITEAELANALRDWRLVEEDEQVFTAEEVSAANGLVEALGKLEAAERDAETFFAQHGDSIKTVQARKLDGLTA